MKGPVSSAAPPFRPRATDEVKTPRSRRDDGYLSSTPNQVSDDSGEVEPESDLSLSQSLSHDLSKSLSHISHAPSSEEDSPTGPTINGRWNIPFDGSFEELVAKKSPLGKGNALKEIGFVPISSTREHRRPSLGLGVAPVRPLAMRSPVTSPFAQADKRGLLKDIMNEKENVSPKPDYASTSALHDTLR